MPSRNLPVAGALLLFDGNSVSHTLSAAEAVKSPALGSQILSYRYTDKKTAEGPKEKFKSEK